MILFCEMMQHWFLVAVLIPYNLIHPVPGMSFSMTIEQLGQRPSYRVESLVAGWARYGRVGISCLTGEGSKLAGIDVMACRRAIWTAVPSHAFILWHLTYV